MKHSWIFFPLMFVAMMILALTSEKSKIRPVLRPTYKIQGDPNKPVMIEPGALTQTREETTARLGLVFHFEFELIQAGGTYNLEPKTQIEMWRVENPRVLRIENGEFTAVGIGKTLVWCKGVVELPNGEQKQFLINELVHVIPVPRKRSSCEKVQPLPLAVAIFIVNVLTFALICDNITSCSKRA